MPTEYELMTVEEPSGELSLDQLLESSEDILRQFPKIGHAETLLKLMDQIQQHNTSMNILAFEVGRCLFAIKELEFWKYGGGDVAYEDFSQWLQTSEIARHGYRQLMHWLHFYELVKQVENCGLNFLPILEYATPLSALKIKHVEVLVRSMKMSWNEIGRRRVSEAEKKQALDEIRAEINQEILSVLEASEESLCAEAVSRLKNANEMEPHQLTLWGLREEGNEFVFEVRIRKDDRRVWMANFPANKVRLAFQLPNDPDKRLRSPKEAGEYLDEQGTWPDTVEGSVEEEAS